MSDIVSVYAVFGSQEEAGQISRTMIEKQLAACVNILTPCQSIFEWDGKIAEETEVPAIFKTTRGKADALIAAIAERHSYDVPAICVWPIENAFKAYSEWVVGRLGE